MSYADPIVYSDLELFAHRGNERNGVEDVSQSELAIQSAPVAEKEGAHPRLISAALVHDVGHLLGGSSPPRCEAENYEDFCHERR